MPNCVQHGKGKKKFILASWAAICEWSYSSRHALNKILKDIIVKSKTLSGFDSPSVPGWDCHGLPIELNVEKKIGKPGVKSVRQNFAWLAVNMLLHLLIFNAKNLSV